MSTHKYIDRICVAALVLSLLLTSVFLGGEALDIQAAGRMMGYEDRLFDTSVVHTIDIVMDDWDGFLQTAQSEEYTVCSVVIDGEAYKNVGIRGKGNTSLSTVASMNSERYSFKIEFDQYDSGKTYHGLDKLSLNNLIQDTTYMKDYLTYRMMAEFGAAAPLCSFVWITVNGEDWGLYLAVEAVEESFLKRNYGSDYGELYKPDSMNMGGGRGNGKDFRPEDFDFEAMEQPEMARPSQNKSPGGAFSPDISEDAVRAALEEQGIDPAVLDGIDFENPTMDTARQAPEQLEGADLQAMMETVMGSDSFKMPDMGDFGGFGGMGGGGAKLQYVDDDPASYTTIFDSAKTDVSKADQTRLIASLKTLSTGNAAEVLDLDTVMRYFVVHNYVVNADSYTGSMIHNYYLYEEDGKLAMLPWDYNLAFGTFQSFHAGTAVNDDIDRPLSVSGTGDRPMVDWIFQSESYTEQYHQYFAEFLDTVDPAAIIEEAAALISPYVEQDPTAFYTVQKFQTGVETLREFCKLRSESIRNQLSGTADTVDASHLDLSNMGTMNMGGGGFPGGGSDRGEEAGQPQDNGRPQMPNGGAMPQMPDNIGGGMAQFPGGFPAGSPVTQTDSANPETTPPTTFSGEMPQEFPEGNFPNAGGSAPQADSSALLPLAVSIAVLLLGLAVALGYKRK